MSSQGKDVSATLWTGDTHERDWFPVVTAYIRHSTSTQTTAVIVGIVTDGIYQCLKKIRQNFNFVS